MFQSICEQWNALYDETEGELEVGACNTSRRFIRIGPTVSVSAFLTYSDDESNDLLLKVLLMHCGVVHLCSLTFIGTAAGCGHAAEAPEHIPGGV